MAVVTWRNNTCCIGRTTGEEETRKSRPTCFLYKSVETVSNLERGRLHVWRTDAEYTYTSGVTAEYAQPWRGRLGGGGVPGTDSCLRGWLGRQLHPAGIDLMTITACSTLSHVNTGRSCFHLWCVAAQSSAHFLAVLYFCDAYIISFVVQS